MTKKQRVILSVGALLGGWLLCAWGTTTTLAQPVPTLCIVLGLVFAVSGFISIILSLRKPTTTKKIGE